MWGTRYRIPYKMFFDWFVPHHKWGNRMMAVLLPAITGGVLLGGLDWLGLASLTSQVLFAGLVGIFSAYLLNYHTPASRGVLMIVVSLSELIFLGLVTVFWFAPMSLAGPLQTNQINFPNPPSYVTESRLEKITTKIQDLLEWDIRRIEVRYHGDVAEFEALHKLGPSVQAYSEKNGTVHLGPKVNQTNFDTILGHELVHVILRQKYKGAIPVWLEEGMANYLSQNMKADYGYLAGKPVGDVAKLSHPYKGNVDFRLHYQTSLAVMEMIAAHCSLKDLLQLSVGKKLETYLATYCEINDLNAEYAKWLKRHVVKPVSTSGR